MSTPAKQADTQQKNNQSSSTGNEKSFADRVNEVVNAATVDNKGNIILPDDLSEEMRFAATAEKRRRDTQSSYTKEVQSRKALEIEKSTLLSEFGSVEVKLTQEQTEELEDLKFSDPEAWRTKLNQYESEAKDKRIKAIDEKLKTVSKTTLDNDELESRKQKLEAFAAEHTDFVLDDDVIANDIPQRITKKLATGAISFDEYLNECYNYLKTGKVVKQDDVIGQPNLGKAGGSHQPEKIAQSKDDVLSYNKEVY